MTSSPRQPAAYLRSATATSADDLAIAQQRREVLSAVAALGWSEPTVYTATGTLGWNRLGSALAALASHVLDMLPVLGTIA